MARPISGLSETIIARVHELHIGTFVRVSNSFGNRQVISNLIYNSQNKPFVQMAELNIPPEREYRIFEYQKKLYVARMK